MAQKTIKYKPERNETNIKIVVCDDEGYDSGYYRAGFTGQRRETEEEARERVKKNKYAYVYRRGLVGTQGVNIALSMNGTSQMTFAEWDELCALVAEARRDFERQQRLL